MTKLQTKPEILLSQEAVVQDAQRIWETLNWGFTWILIPALALAAVVMFALFVRELRSRARAEGVSAGAVVRDVERQRAEKIRERQLGSRDDGPPIIIVRPPESQRDAEDASFWEPRNE